MANIIVTEFSGTALFGAAQAARNPLAAQTVAIGATTAATSNACTAATGLLRIHAEATCNIVIAEDPNAETGIIIPMGAGHTDYFTVDPRSSMKVAVVSRTVA